jgi:PAS domain S-box-containing protein
VLHDVTRLDQHVPGSSREDLALILAEQSPVGLFHADADGRCAFVNTTFCELTGLTPSQARDQRWLECIHPEDRRGVERAWRHATDRGATFHAEHRIQPAVGAAIRVATECAPVSDSPAGGFAGSITRLGEVGRAALARRPVRRRSGASSERG